MAKIKIDENFVAQNIKQIIEKLSVSATIEVSKEDGIFIVDISSEDSSLLIGKHGSNLDSLQFVLAVRLKTLGADDDFEVFVDVNGWRRQNEEKLKKMAEEIADKVATSGKTEYLYNLRSSERRIIHKTLTDHSQVTTLSEGEGMDRCLLVKPK